MNQKAKELPGMPKIDKCGELALEYLELRNKKAELDGAIKDARITLTEHLIASNRASIRVAYGKEHYTLELAHVEETEKIKIRKG